MHNLRVRRSAPLLLLVVLCLTQGCVAISSVQTADTLGRGRLQVGVEPGVAGVVRAPPGLSAAPVADVAVRYGVADRVDVGGRFGQSGLELALKAMLTPRAWPLIVSLAPSASGQLRVSSTLEVTGQILNLALPLLLGLRLGPHQLVLGPRLHLLASLPADPNEAATRRFAAGGSLGVALRVSRAVTVLPELAVLAPLSPQPLLATPDTFSQLSGGVLVQARLAFLLGPGAEPP